LPELTVGMEKDEAEAAVLNVLPKTVRVADIKWFVDGAEETGDFTVDAGKNYRVELTLEAAPGRPFPADDEVTLNIAGTKTTENVVDGKVTVKLGSDTTGLEVALNQITDNDVT